MLFPARLVPLTQFQLWSPGTCARAEIGMGQLVGVAVLTSRWRCVMCTSETNQTTSIPIECCGLSDSRGQTWYTHINLALLSSLQFVLELSKVWNYFHSLQTSKGRRSRPLDVPLRPHGSKGSGAWAVTPQGPRSVLSPGGRAGSKIFRVLRFLLSDWGGPWTYGAIAKVDWGLL